MPKKDKDIPKREQAKIDYDIKFLVHFPGFAQRMADRHGITKKEVEDIIAHFFFSLKDAMTDWRMPTIILPVVGRFVPTLGKISWYIHRAFRNYRKGYFPKDKLRERIEKVWPIRSRLREEAKFTSKTTVAESTWRRWRDYGHKPNYDIFKKDANAAEEE